MANLAELVVGIRADTDKLNKGIDSSVDKVRDAGGKMSGFGSRALGTTLVAGSAAAATGVGALAVGVGALGVASFDVATQVQSSQATIQASLGVTADRATELSKVAQNVFADGLTGSVGDATEAIIETRRQLGNLTDNELQSAASNAIKFATVYDQDVGESLMAARALTDEFGLSQQQAFDFLASGMQKGLNASDDFLDSVGEYSNLFATGGADAGQFFSLLETGLNGGVLGTDKAADAFKEFQIRFTEGNKDLTEGLATLGVDYETLRAQVDSGAITMTDAFGQVLGRVGEVDTGLLTNQEAVAKLGTQFEDLGIDAVAAMSTAKTGMDDVAGASDALNAHFDTNAARMTELQNRALIALAPLGDVLLGGFEAAFPALEAMINWFTVTALPVVVDFATMAGQWISNFITEATPVVQAFSEKWNATLAPALVIVRQAFDEISSALSPLLGDFSVTNELVEDLGEILDIAVIALQGFAVVMHGVAGGVRSVTGAVRTVIGQFGKMKDFLGSLDDNLPSWLRPGSPPPLYHALKDVGGALKSLPSFDKAFDFPRGEDGNSVVNAASGSKGGGDQRSFTINVNNPRDGEEAKNSTLQAARALGFA